jgi:thiosulfate reductase cytochrome b subunit
MNGQKEWIIRHSLAVRVCHWINAAAFFGLLVTGFAIFVTYPELYWGQVGYRGHEPSFGLADLGIENNPWAWIDGPRRWGRNYHFTFAWIFVINGLTYLALGLLRRRLMSRMLPTRHELTMRHLAADIRSHLHLRMPGSVAADGYNILQKLSYLVVIFVLSPLIVITGLGQSPAITTVAPWLLDTFGGHQSLRTLHMISILLLTLFVLVHVFQVFVSGFVNEMRSMITGRFAVSKEERHER